MSTIYNRDVFQIFHPNISEQGEICVNTLKRDILDTKDREESTFLKAIMHCGKEGGRLVVDEKMGQDTYVHTLICRIGVNPVTGTSAIAVAILTIANESTSGMATTK